MYDKSYNGEYDCEVCDKCGFELGAFGKCIYCDYEHEENTVNAINPNKPELDLTQPKFKDKVSSEVVEYFSKIKLFEREYLNSIGDLIGHVNSNFISKVSLNFKEHFQVGKHLIIHAVETDAEGIYSSKLVVYSNTTYKKFYKHKNKSTEFLADSKTLSPIACFPATELGWQHAKDFAKNILEQ